MVKHLALVVVAAATLIALYGIALAVCDLNRADLTEGLTLAMSMRWSATPPDPGWLTAFPNTSIAYGPEFPWLVKSLAALFPGTHMVLLGRAISVAAGAGTLALIVWAVRRAGRTVTDAWLAALVFLTAPLVTHLWWQARVEPLAIVWTIAAYGAAGLKRGPAIAALCLVAGSLAKQTAAFHAVPIGIWYLATSARPFRPFLTFAAVGTAAGLAVWLPILLAYDGFFWQSAVKFHGLKGTSPWRAYVLLYTYLPSVTMGAAIAAAARAVFTRPFAQSLGDRWWLGFVFSLATDTFMLMKDGSWTHYALPAIVFGAILIGRHAREMIGASTRVAPWALAAVSVMAVMPTFMSLRGQGWRLEPQTRVDFVRRVYESSGRPSVVLTDGDITPFLVGTGATPMVADSFALKVLDERRRIDLGPLLAAMDDGTLSLVLLGRTLEQHKATIGGINQVWPVAVLDRLAARYVETTSAPGVYVYRPR